MTRAQSQVIVIGDAVALCSFGKCSKIWKHYIQECVEHASVYPEGFTIEQIKQAIMDQEVWSKPTDEDSDVSSDTDSWTSDFDVNADDPILQELLDSSRDARVTVTQDGFLDVESGRNPSKSGIGHYTSFPPCTLRSYLEMQPKLYKRCELVKEGFEKAYALSLDESPPLHILINGRVNCGMAFSGDEVVVQILSSSVTGGINQDLHGKVVGILSKGESQKTFVCTMDPHDTRLMVPINHSVTKIFSPGFKDKPDMVPIRVFQNERIQTLRTERITEETKRTRLFVVQIICWREGFYYPLGIVTKVLPLAVTAEQGLKILDVEYELHKHTTDPVAMTKEMTKLRKKFSPPLESIKDCRNFLTFTIDPEGARDLDDAISIRDLGSCYEVGVHIADVASAVPKGSALDEEAKRRGATYYSPGRNPLHMFPSDLSQDLFSLLPEKDRRVISLFVVAEKETDVIKKGTFSLSLINSDRQFSYEEAEKLLKNHAQGPLEFKTVEECLAVLYRFSTVHRKCRLQEDCYYEQLDEDCSPGNRRAHQMIAELMIMFNSFVAEFLSSKNQTKNLMPLRCQNPPNLQRLMQFKNKHSNVIPLSIHLSHHVDSQPVHKIATANSEFVMVTRLWDFLQSTAKSQDFHKIIDLLITDDLHPKLAHVCLEFRKLLGRSSFSRSGSTEQSKVGHYSLEIESYTWASSPIRRYIDVVVQRHLHTTLSKKQPEYLPGEIDFLCHDFSQKHAKAQAYEKRAYSLQMAMNLQGQAKQKLAFVVTVESRCFGVLFPLNHKSLPDCIKLNYSVLQLSKQPAFNSVSGCTNLTWKRRVYSVDAEKKLSLPHTMLHDNHVTSFSPAVWQEALKAVRNEQLEDVVPLLCRGRRQSTVAVGRTERSRCTHYMELSLEMHAGSTVTLQLTSSVLRGFLTPSVQLWTAAPGFDICVEHSEKPIDCFTEYATLAPKHAYKDVIEYRRVWRPLSAMESATSAVEENSSIVLHDVTITWSRKQQPLLGSFKLSKDFLLQCCIKPDWNHCYLCIRLENLEPRSPVENISQENLCQTLGKLNLSGDGGNLELDPSTYTWVAHGLTGCFDDSPPDRGICQRVDFQLHHVSMTTIPSQVFQDSCRYTVEIIPQLLPDVRKELAIEGLRRASNLAKCIAFGWHPQQMGQPPISKIQLQNKFNVFVNWCQLNDSQNAAISRALREPFTLIQGPPGTGKTMVGVHIVYWFNKLNEEADQKRGPVFESVEGQVNQCIMYCGPSNKSVDVVAEMLLAIRGAVRPLRVYSEQMEVVDFPYPGSSMHINQKSLHDGRPQQELRSITLHHRIRMPTNECHADILEFDKRIRAEEEMSLQDIKEYKALLKKAREIELKRHDVILCTCCTASQDSFTKIHAKQILIDECGMCTEPETLIPLVCHKKAEKVVLLGDHKQLRPVVQNDYCRRLGMEVSLFERYCNQALMLNIQYRMHMDICSFPSNEFYDGRLNTWDQLKRYSSAFYHTRKACCPIIFGHVEGKEQSLVVSTKEGNENSKANAEEAAHAVRIAKQLTLDRSAHDRRIFPKDIAILTPYNAQVGEINKQLQKEGLRGINVSTITKSQGSEWRYVIFSTVRSCSQYETDRNPTKSWLQKNLGFVTDPNQVNVALTRAQEGLCILGNRHLLLCCTMWKRLLDHYKLKNASVLAHEIHVRR